MKKIYRNLLYLTLTGIFSCSDGEYELKQISDQSTEWVLLGNHEFLGEGHRFRMSPLAEPSKCFLPGSSGVSKQVCGTSAEWHIRKNVSTEKSSGEWVKIIQSLSDYSCLIFDDSGASPVIRTGTCDDNDPNQWFTFYNSYLTKANFDGTAMKTPSNMDPLSFYVSPTTDAANKEIWRNFITDGHLHSLSTPNEKSERSVVIWGNVPAIRKIAIATVANTASTEAPAYHRWISGIELTYSNGKRDTLGGCWQARGGCQVKKVERPEYANPYELQGKEYISKIEVKLSETTSSTSWGREERLTEIRVYVKNGDEEKLVIHEGTGNGNAPWISLAATADGQTPDSRFDNRVIAGLHVGTAHYVPDNRLGAPQVGGESYIVGIGGIFVDRRAYEAHNSEIYGNPNKESHRFPESIEEGREVIGLTTENSRLGQYGSSEAIGHERQEFHKLFGDQSYKYSTLHYGNRMTGAVNIGSIRICGGEELDGIFIRPSAISEEAPAEGIGMFDCSNPVMAELEADEYITAVHWKNWNRFHMKVGINAPRILGPVIVGLRIDTNKRAERLIWEASGAAPKKIEWSTAFSRPDYAIIGFHGVANNSRDPNYLSSLKLAGAIVNLSPWYGKVEKMGLTPTSAYPTPYEAPACYRKSLQERGVGKLPWVCNGDEQNGLCYDHCPADFPSNEGPVCWKPCNAGYTDDGLFCRIDVDTKGFDGCPWYNKCGVASDCDSCPPGYRHDACTCHRDTHIYPQESYRRGAGKPLACPDDMIYDNGLCYEPCN